VYIHARISLGWLLIVVGILLAVAFMILLERKVLGYIQIRKGPNKVGVLGIIQSIRDAIKLFVKEFLVLIRANFLVYLICPIISLFVRFFLWSVVFTGSNIIHYSYGLIFFFLLYCFQNLYSNRKGLIV